MRILILGSGAGGGIPQWNAPNANGRAAFKRDPLVPFRSQCSIAASADGVSWLLFNAAPDLRAQIIANPQLHPRSPDIRPPLSWSAKVDHPRLAGGGGSSSDITAASPDTRATPREIGVDGPPTRTMTIESAVGSATGRAIYPTRSTPIAAVFLTGGEIDQVTGLLTLRERQPFALYASAATHAALAMNPIFEALNAELVPRLTLAADETAEPLPGLCVTAIDTPGKVPLYLERMRADPTASEPGDCFSYLIEHGGKRAVFVPGVADLSPGLRAACTNADLALIDGTLFTDDEMIALGEGVKTGRRMGHRPMTGEGGMIEAFADIPVKRRMFIHVNNTNPAARLDSPEHAQLAAQGWDVAEDGMEIML